jgi:tetratricopeptide (TPR) repeat protein
MWQKYFKIAERQLEAGKDKTFEGHALKALQCAEAANSPVQIFKTLHLMRIFYAENNNPLLLETLHKSVAAAEKAHGANSIELAEELEMLGAVLEMAEDFKGAETAKLQALAIRRHREGQRPEPYPTFDLEAEEEDDEHFDTDSPIGLMDAMGNLATFYIDQKEFAKAETLFLEWLERNKKYYGPASEPVEEIADIYAEIAEGLGRADEAKELRELFDSPITAEEEEILTALENNPAKEDFEKTIQLYRESLKKLEAISDQRCATVSASEPFKEMKLQVYKEASQTFKKSLGELLRLQSYKEKKAESLIEAEEIFRTLLAETEDDTYRILLLHTLLDLSKESEAHKAELEALMLEMPDHIDTLYSKALLLYRSEGSTPASRQALNTAFKANPQVLAMLAAPVTEVPEDEMSADAYRYSSLSHYAWHETEGSIDFTTETVMNALSPALRRRVEAMAKAAEAEALAKEAQTAQNA